VIVPAPGRYRIDPDRSTIALRTKHFFGLGTVEATVAVSRGEIQVVERVENSQVSVQADATSFDSRNAGRDKRVRSTAFLDAGVHSEITFASNAVESIDGRWVLHGILTARENGASCDLAVVEATENAGELTFVATGTVDRYAHGIKGGKGFVGRYLAVTVTAVAAGA
jgi:polyisoprenoid-binding protein YceI